VQIHAVRNDLPFEVKKINNSFEVRTITDNKNHYLAFSDNCFCDLLFEIEAVAIKI